MHNLDIKKQKTSLLKGFLEGMDDLLWGLMGKNI